MKWPNLLLRMLPALFGLILCCRGLNPGTRLTRLTPHSLKVRSEIAILLAFISGLFFNTFMVASVVGHYRFVEF